MKEKVDRIGEKYLSGKGELFTIIDYNTRKNCTIQFEDGTILKNISYSNIIKRNIKNPNYPNIYGIGYHGIGEYSSRRNRKAYSVWNDMFKRCYSKEINHKTYKDCYIDKNWYNFQNFAKWYEDNWKDYMIGWHLDKDVLFKGNKIYSSKTCVFVPVSINSLFTKRQNKRGILPIGVIKKGFMYAAQITKNNVHINIDSLSTPEEAFQAYKAAKEEHIKEVAEKWKSDINIGVYQALINYQVEITD